MQNALYLHLREQVQEAQLQSELDAIIGTAYSEYMKDCLSDTEYGKIYFAAVAKMPSGRR